MDAQNFYDNCSDAPTDLSRLRVAIIPILQTYSQTSLQCACPTTLVHDLRYHFAVKTGGQPMPTLDSLISDLKNLKAVHALQQQTPPPELQRDEALFVRQQYTKRFVNTTSCDSSEIARDLCSARSNLQDPDYMEGCSITGVAAWSVAEAFLVQSLMVFPSDDISKTLMAISERRGNPELIIFFGHGSNNDLKAPMGRYDHMTGAYIAQAILTAKLLPSMVMLVACESHGVAQEAHKWWSCEQPKNPCTFLAPTTERDPVELCYAGFTIAPFIHTYLLLILRHYLGSAGSAIAFRLPRGNAFGQLNFLRGNRPSGKKLLNLYYIILLSKQLHSIDWYLSGEFPSDTAEKVISRALIDPHHTLWAEMREVYQVMKMKE
jgi:hypothetical protein